MELLQLRAFQAVARHQHVTRAADELNVAQPTLSRTIAQLEAELGVPLFDRHGRRVELNRFGAAFLTRASRALFELDQGRRELEDAAGLDQGSVTVAAETLRLVTDLAARFLTEHPSVSLRLSQLPAPAMAAQLRANEVDLCLASQPLDGPGLRAVELFSEEVLLAVPPSHRLAGRRRVGVEELVGEPFVTPRRGYWQRTLADRLLAGVGAPLTVACEGEEPAAVRGLISAGVGAGLLPAVARRAALRPPVAWIHLDAPGCQRTLSVVRREDAYVSAAARRFQELAIRHFRRRPAEG